MPFRAALTPRLPMVVACLWVGLATPSLRAQTSDSSLKPVDSLRSWFPLGLHAMPNVDGDSTLIDAYVSFLTPGDSVWTRKWALYGTAWLLAQADHRHLRRAAVLFLWPDRVSKSAPPGARPATWSMLFARDSLGCWSIVNDSTPIARCNLRQDPASPLRRP